MRDVETGAEQTIISNRIHSYFVQTKRKVANSSEGHVYAGVLDDGHWVKLSAFSLLASLRFYNALRLSVLCTGLIACLEAILCFVIYGHSNKRECASQLMLRALAAVSEMNSRER